MSKYLYAVAVGLIILTSIVWEFRSNTLISSIMISSETPVASIDLLDGDHSNLRNLTEALSQASHIYSHLPDYHTIDIKTNPKVAFKIEEERKNAIIRRLLIEPSQYKATIDISGFKTKAKIRLKGELEDHWNTRLRSSFAIELRDATNKFPMTKFSISKLSSRQFPADLLHQALKVRFGLIDRKMVPVRVHFNGEDWGLMIAEEQWGKDFFVNHKLQEGPIVKFGNDRSQKISEVFKVHSNVSAELKDVGERIAKSINLGNTDAAFDYESIAMEIALSEVFGSYHSLLHSNARLYYDPVQHKIKLITSDQDRPVLLSNSDLNVRRYWRFMNEWRFFDNLVEDDLLLQIKKVRKILKATIWSECSTAKDILTEEWKIIPNIERWIDEYCKIINVNASKLEEFKFFEKFIAQNPRHNDKKTSFSHKSSSLYPLVAEEGGRVDINKSMSVRDLFIDSGATVNICHRCDLKVFGKVHLRGRKDKPIKIVRSDGTGVPGTIEIFNHDKTSILEHTIIEFSRSYAEVSNKAGLLIIGGVVNTDNLSVYNANYEDAINIKNSQVDLKNIKIYNSKSDGIDLDFVTGNVRNIIVENSGGDGLDVSGSDLFVSYVDIDKALDKGISVGEKATLKIENVTINDSSICIAAKDGSKVELGSTINLKNCTNFDLAFYRKKRQFGNPIIGFTKIPTNQNIMLQNGVFDKIDTMDLLTKGNGLFFASETYISNQYNYGFMRK